MRYSSTHKQETRDKLLNSGRAIAKSGGFDSMGVDALMKAIGLTGGAFYSHFASKAELFSEIIDRELLNSSEMLEGATEEGMETCIRNYLSNWHAEHPESGCVLPTLGPEIARADLQVRSAVERSAKTLHSKWSKHMGDPDAAWALISQCVGAVLLSRLMESKGTRQQVLASSRHFLGRSIKQLEGLSKS